MKVKLMTLLVLVLTVILLTGFRPVLAASPAGEVKTLATELGVEMPLPHLERTHSLNWMGLLYDNLVGCNAQGKLSPDWGLADKWEMSPDGLTWTFYLRKGVKFHDGVELTAKDVKFSLELCMQPDAAVAEVGYIRENIKDIDAKDPYVVILHCKKPSLYMAHYVSNMSGTGGMVVPKEYYERLGKDQFAKRPIGSGPYKWHSQMVGSFIKLEATDKHWRDGVPRFKYMTFSIIPEETTQMAMLRTGEGDICRISRESAKEALNAGLNILTKENAAAVVFYPNMQYTPPFSDIRFRKALNLAIDKEAIIKQIFVGLAKPTASLFGSNISVVGGDPMLKPYPYDPQEARRLIKEVGFEGQEFTVVSYLRAGCPEFTRVVETLAGYWQKIGLKPKIQASDWNVFRNAWAGQKSQNMIHGADEATPPDFVTILEKAQERWWFGNKSGRYMVNIPELNEKFERIRKSMDIGEISKLLVEIYRYAYDQYLMIPICQMPDIICSTKRIPQWDPGLRRTDTNYYDLIRQR